MSDPTPYEADASLESLALVVKEVIDGEAIGLGGSLDDLRVAAILNEAKGSIERVVYGG